MTLAQRVELNATILSTWHLHDTHRMLVEDKRIRIVIHHYNVMVFGKLHQSLVGFHTCISTSRHVRIVGPHQFHMTEVHFLQGIKVWLPIIILTQVIIGNLSTQYLVDGSIGRIARIWYEYLVTRIAESQGDV